MMRSNAPGCRIAAVWMLLVLCAMSAAAAAGSRPYEGFVLANGVRLEYLDWGGSGPPLILIHGLGDDPYVFDDLAPAFTDRFHVIAYARRASGGSDVKGPYDLTTLTEDLRGLMDALGFAKASLIGWSAGGNEMTEMAATHPERVSRIVYFDSAYDWSDPEFRRMFSARPVYTRPGSAMASFAAYESYEHSMWYASFPDMGRMEPYLRRKVVIQPDGSVQERLPAQVREQLYATLFANKPRNYLGVRCPVLALYPEHWYPDDMLDPARRRQALAYDRTFAPFKASSIERVKREIANVEIVHVPGAHVNFIFVGRDQVIAATRRFLTAAH